MSTEITRLTENKLFELLKPKQQDLLRMIGEDRLKKEASFALQTVMSSDQLQKAIPITIAKAIFNLALTGLSLNPISKLAYLTPRYVKGQIEAILMPSYQGLVKLITDTGSVKTVYAYCVYEGDEFMEILGTSVEIIHKPARTSRVIEKVYAVAILPDDTKMVEVLGKEEVYEIRERSDGYRAFIDGKIKSNPWVTDEGEMFRKTAIKRITKYVPKTEKWKTVNEAINIDNQDYPASSGQEDYIYSLIQTSSYKGTEFEEIIMSKLEDGLSSLEASNIIEDLQNNQLDPVKSGLNYNAMDAKKALENAIKKD